MLLPCIRTSVRKLTTGDEVLLYLSRQYHLPAKMKAMVINDYIESVADMKTDFEHVCPTEADLKPNQAIVKVHAASVNYLDIEVLKGFGRKYINLLRKQAKVDEFPLILGRDYSGEIVATGKKFKRFEPGDEVYGISGLCHQGSHAEYTVVNRHEVSAKPKNLSHVEAATIPGVGSIGWNVLVETGAISKGGKHRRVFIPGGSGGFGVFACQLCVLFGHTVVTTCPTHAVNLLEGLGVHRVIDYQSPWYEDDLRSSGPFDVIVGTLRQQKHIEFFQKLLKPQLGSQYISLHPNLLEEGDEEKSGLGGSTAVGNLFKFTINQQYTGKGLFQWGFNGHEGHALNEIGKFLEEGTIRPVIDKVFPFENIVDAYKHFDSGNVSGKTVISFVD